MSADRRRKSRLAGTHPAYGDGESPASRTPATRAPAIPEPYVSDATGPLDAREQELRAACEDSVRRLYAQFWETGKAIQVIHDGRLYRATHDTFEDYAVDVLGMSRPQAYRLMQAWPIAEALARVSPIGDTTITLSQVRELVPLADVHGVDAAVTVYSVVVDAGHRPTAALLKGVVAALPAGQWDTEDARARVQRFLSGESPAPAARPQLDPAETFTSSAQRAVAALQRTVKPETIHAAVAADPERVREFVTALRSIADEIEKEVEQS